MILSPSLLSADVGNLAAELSALEAAGVQWVHWDVMDGVFVPNITFGQHVVKQLRKRSGLFFDVHLMIMEPETYLAEFQAAGADMLVVHAEATRHLQRTLAEIRRLGMKAGVALNPATPLSALEYVLEDADMVLLMRRSSRSTAASRPTTPRTSWPRARTCWCPVRRFSRFLPTKPAVWRSSARRPRLDH